MPRGRARSRRSGRAAPSSPPSPSPATCASPGPSAPSPSSSTTRSRTSRRCASPRSSAGSPVGSPPQASSAALLWRSGSNPASGSPERRCSRSASGCVQSCGGGEGSEESGGGTAAHGFGSRAPLAEPRVTRNRSASPRGTANHPGTGSGLTRPELRRVDPPPALLLGGAGDDGAPQGVAAPEALRCALRRRGVDLDRDADVAGAGGAFDPTRLAHLDPDRRGPGQTAPKLLEGLPARLAPARPVAIGTPVIAGVDRGVVVADHRDRGLG